MNTNSEILAVVAAAESGKPIEARFLNPESKWTPCPHPVWNFQQFEYRVAGEQETGMFVPLDAAEEFVKDAADNLIRDLRSRAVKAHLL